MRHRSYGPAKWATKGLALALSLLAPSLLALSLSGCVAPVGPVEVARFHLPDTTMLGQGTIAVMPGPGMNPTSLEQRSYETAVAAELTRLGYATNSAGSGAQLAMVRVTRHNGPGASGSPPVRIIGGGTTGSYGTAAGVGLSFALGAPQVATELSVIIRDAASGKALWEGRASFTVPASSPLASTQLGAPKLAQALFAGFPGQSGETLTIRP